MSKQIQTVETLALVADREQAALVAANLRDASIPTHQYWVEDSYSFAENLARRDWDLVIIAISDNEQHIPACILRYPDTPFLAITKKNKSNLSDQLLQHGITDVTSFSRPARLQHTLQRALVDASLRREYRQMRKNTDDHESLLKNLLRASDEPIAFLHQGMHSFVNPAYLLMMGLSDSATATATPLLDLIDSKSHDALKKLFKDFSLSRTFHARLPVKLNNSNGRKSSEMPASVVLDMTVARFEGEQVVQTIVRKHAAATPIIAPTQQPISNKAVNSDIYATDIGSQPQSAATVAINRQVDDSADRAAKIQDSDASMLESTIDSTLRNTAATDITSFNLTMDAGDLKKLQPNLDETQVGHAASYGLSLLARKSRNAPSQKATLKKISAAQLTENDPEWTRRIGSVLNSSELRISVRPINSLKLDMFERYQLNLTVLPTINGVQSAERFISQARRHDLLYGVDRWLIHNAASQLAKQLVTNPGTRFFVSLHGNQLLLEKMIPWLKSIISKFDLPQKSLNVLLDGGGLTDNAKLSNDIILKLKALNIGVGISGLNNELNLSSGMDGDQTIGLELLESLPVDFALLDSSFSDQIADVQARDALERLLQRCQAASITTMIEASGPQSLSAIWKLGADCFIGDPVNGGSGEYEEDLDLTAAI